MFVRASLLNGEDRLYNYADRRSLEGKNDCSGESEHAIY